MQVRFLDMPDGVSIFRIRYKRSSQAWTDARDVSVSSQDSEYELFKEIGGLQGCKEAYDFEVTALGDGTKYRADFGTPTVKSKNLPCPRFLGLMPDHVMAWRITTPPTNETTPALPATAELPTDAFDAATSSGASSWSGKGGMSVCWGTCSANEDGQLTSVVADYSGAECPGFACADIRREPQAGHSHSEPHITSSTIYILHGGQKGGKFIFWTSDSRLHDHFVPGTREAAKYRYLTPTMVHEFGHALGIGDLYESWTGFKNMAAAMNDHRRNPTPTSHDSKHLRAIYYGHFSHR